MLRFVSLWMVLITSKEWRCNKMEGIKVNGTLLALTDKIADILIAEGKTNGTISANGVDIPVHGLAALAYKSEVAESDLAAALKAIIDAKAKQADLDTLTGDGEGSISKMIDAAINKFATDVTDDNVVNSYKELIDWVAKHGPEATKMAGGISENKTATGASFQVGYGETRASYLWEYSWMKEWLDTYNTDPERAEKALEELEKAFDMPYMGIDRCDDATRNYLRENIDKAKLGDPSGFTESIRANYAN